MTDFPGAEMKPAMPPLDNITGERPKREAPVTHPCDVEDESRNGQQGSTRILAPCECHQLVGRHAMLGAASKTSEDALRRSVPRSQEDASVLG